MKTNLSRTVIIFVALTAAGVCLAVFGQGAAESAVRAVLPLVGTALFSAGLTFFLLRMAGRQE
jgi:hypothetical protein